MNNDQIRIKLESIVSNNDITELEKAVILDVLDQDDINSYINDVLYNGCQSGIVSSLIYYVDTKEFAKKHIEDILELYQTSYEEIGEYPVMEGNVLNWLAWFGYEMTIQTLSAMLEADVKL